jgi:hypothetical protein
MRILILLALILLGLSGCDKKGCMDCNATNYDSEVEKEDDSCEFLNEERLGSYAISDSISEWNSTEWYYPRSYKIQIERSECNPDSLIIIGYGNYRPETPFPVKCNVVGDSLIIPMQNVEGPDFSYEADWGNKIYVRQNRAWFSGDSIFIDGWFSHHNDTHHHVVWGVKE